MPSRRTDPCHGRRAPAPKLSRVLFPAPFGPKRTVRPSSGYQDRSLNKDLLRRYPKVMFSNRIIRTSSHGLSVGRLPVSQQKRSKRLEIDLNVGNIKPLTAGCAANLLQGEVIVRGLNLTPKLSVGVPTIQRLPTHVHIRQVPRCFASQLHLR